MKEIENSFEIGGFIDRDTVSRVIKHKDCSYFEDMLTTKGLNMEIFRELVEKNVIEHSKSFQEKYKLKES